MKKSILFLLHFVPYFIPYVYLSMMVDFTYRTIFGYLIMIAMTSFLAFSGKRSRQLLSVFLGNLTSTCFSLWLITRTPDELAPWDGFFKPFDGFHMVIIASVLNFIPQAIAIWLATEKKHSQ